MIISASRRTDIPAFYSEWLVRRLRAGFCEVQNPMNLRQVSRISLLSQDVELIVFWTRSPRAMLGRLAELDRRDLRYYFQFTVCGYGAPIDGKSPSVATAVDTFQRLASRIGPGKVIWRYDPIVFSEVTDVDFHLSNFEKISSSLKGYTSRCVVSIWDLYRKLGQRLQTLELQGIHFRQPQGEELDRLIPGLVQLCSANGMEIVSCAEDVDLVRYGVRQGKCVDDDLIRRVFGINVCHQKDGSQRPACGCVQSRDIGAYDSCLFGCVYCYATRCFRTAAANYRKHDPEAASLIPVDLA
jgi:hypothetical protein